MPADRHPHISTPPVGDVAWRVESRPIATGESEVTIRITDVRARTWWQARLLGARKLRMSMRDVDAELVREAA